LVAGNSAVGVGASASATLPLTSTLTFNTTKGPVSGIGAGLYTYGDFVQAASTPAEMGALMSGFIQYMYNTQVSDNGEPIVSKTGITNQEAVASYFAAILFFAALNTQRNNLFWQASPPFYYFNWIYNKFTDVTQTATQVMNFFNNYDLSSANPVIPAIKFTPGSRSSCPANANSAIIQNVWSFNNNYDNGQGAGGCFSCSSSIALSPTDPSRPAYDNNGNPYCTPVVTPLVFNDPNSSVAGKLSIETATLIQQVAQGTSLGSINPTYLYKLIANLDTTQFDEIFIPNGSGGCGFCVASDASGNCVTYSTDTCNWVQYYKIALYDYILQGNVYFRCDVDNFSSTSFDSSLYYGSGVKTSNIAIQTVLEPANTSAYGDNPPAPATTSTVDLTSLTGANPPAATSFNFKKGNFYNWLPSVYQLASNPAVGLNGVVDLAGLNTATPASSNSSTVYSTMLANQTLPNNFWDNKCNRQVDTNGNPVTGTASMMKTQLNIIDLITAIGSKDTPATQSPGSPPSSPAYGALVGGVIEGQTLQGVSSNLLLAAQAVYSAQPLNANPAYGWIVKDPSGNTGSAAYPIVTGGLDDTAAGNGKIVSADVLENFMPTFTNTGTAAAPVFTESPDSFATNDHLKMLNDAISIRNNYGKCWTNYSICYNFITQQQQPPGGFAGFMSNVRNSTLFGIGQSVVMMILMGVVQHKIMQYIQNRNAAKAGKPVTDAKTGKTSSSVSDDAATNIAENWTEVEGSWLAKIGRGLGFGKKPVPGSQGTDPNTQAASGDSPGTGDPDQGPQGPSEGPQGPSEGPQGPQGPGEGPQGPGDSGNGISNGDTGTGGQLSPSQIQKLQAGSKAAQADADSALFEDGQLNLQNAIAERNAIQQALDDAQTDADTAEAEARAEQFEADMAENMGSGEGKIPPFEDLPDAV